jgi:hypothetical protein
MSGLIALRAVFGQDEANHGIRRYRVGGDGLVHVPAEAAFFLVSKGGFVVAKTTVDQVRGSALPVPLPDDTRSDADPSSQVRLHHDDASRFGRCRSQNTDLLVPAKASGDLLVHELLPEIQDLRLGEPEVGPEPTGFERSPVGAPTSTAAPSARG